MKTRLLLLLFITLFPLSALAQAPRSFAVELQAEWATDPVPSVTLSWTPNKDQTKVTIWRKAKSEPTFPAAPKAQLDANADSWTDTKVELGVAYEYRVLSDIDISYVVDTAVHTTRYWAYGYILTGHHIPPLEHGTVLVLVDSTVAEGLEAQMETLRADLETEGWTVIILPAPRHDAADASRVERVREIILEQMFTARPNVESVLLVGHVAIPYAGLINPDAHGDHIGAWPADGIYGDVDGLYTDNTANYTNTSRPVNTNVPGDGKYDQSVFNTTVRIAVGRVDFADLPAFEKSELELLQQYFEKNHAFRTAQYPVIIGGIVDDNFGGYIEKFSASAWRSYGLYAKDADVKAADWFGTLGGPDNYLWAYGCGGGTNTSAGGIGSTDDMASKPVHAAHTQLFGSYFGDWNTRNNILRAVLATSPRAVTSAWSGRPHWYTHHMALGETIGYSTLISQNNWSTNSLGQLGTYLPNYVYLSNGQRGVATAGDRQIHIALLGDPTLRALMSPLPNVTSAAGTTDYPNIVNLTYDSDGGSAYVIYRKNVQGSWELVTPAPVEAKGFRDSLSHEGTLSYRVHACLLRETACGSYYEMGPGKTVDVITTDVAELDGASGLSVALQPNPAMTLTTATVSCVKGGPVEISVVDLTGMTILTERLDVAAGQHHVALPLGSLQMGSYFVIASQGPTRATVRLQIVR